MVEVRRVALSYFAFRYGSSHLFCSGGVGWGVMGFVVFRYGSCGLVSSSWLRYGSYCWVR